jgi:hypothetical protein
VQLMGVGAAVHTQAQLLAMVMRSVHETRTRVRLIQMINRGTSRRCVRVCVCVLLARAWCGAFVCACTRLGAACDAHLARPKQEKSRRWRNWPRRECMLTSVPRQGRGGAVSTLTTMITGRRRSCSQGRLSWC